MNPSDAIEAIEKPLSSLPYCKRRLSTVWQILKFLRE